MVYIRDILTVDYFNTDTNTVRPVWVYNNIINNIARRLFILLWLKNMISGNIYWLRKSFVMKSIRAYFLIIENFFFFLNVHFSYCEIKWLSIDNNGCVSLIKVKLTLIAHAAHVQYNSSHTKSNKNNSWYPRVRAKFTYWTFFKRYFFIKIYWIVQ